MNRFRLAVIMFIVVMAFIGCSDEDYYNEEIPNHHGYSYAEAVKRGDIVIQSRVDNFERFEQFLHNLSNKKEDTIRITGYTHEGDPIFEDLKYDGDVIQYAHDNSNDQYGGEDRGIERDVCTGIIESEDGEGYIDYRLTGCSKYDISLINIDKDIVKQP